MNNIITANTTNVISTTSTNHIVTTDVETNVVLVNSPGPAGPIGPPGTVNSNTGMNITGPALISGSLILTGSLDITGSAKLNGSNILTTALINPDRIIAGTSLAIVTTGSTIFTVSSSSINLLQITSTYVSGAFTGSFSGDGGGLINVPAASIVGLNLSQIASGSATASISPVNGFRVNTNTTITGSLIVSGSSTFTNIGPAYFSGSTVFTQGGATGSFTGSFYGDGSNLTGIVSSKWTGSNPISRESNVEITGSLAVTNVLTASSAIISGNVQVLGTASINTLVVNQTQLSTGSNQFGDAVDDTQTLYGSVIIPTGSLTVTGSLIVTSGISGSVSGSFQGLATGVFSGSASGSFQGLSTGIFSGSASGSFQGSGAGLTSIPASGIVGLNLFQIATGSVTASVGGGSTNFQLTSGSTTLVSADTTGRLAVSKSINVGVPTANPWQSGLNGSYFNNFTSTSDVSEILRFIAGLLSASAPDASPNTKTFASTTQTYSNNGTGTVTAGYVPQSSVQTDILYLIGRGFTQTGSTLFPGKTIYNNSSYAINYSSVAGGTTIVSSSADAQLYGLGLLSSGGPTQFNVSGTINWYYSDNNNETSTATSQSQNLLSTNTFGTTSGLTLAKINTANPAVIPAAYQDGKFANIFSNGLYNGGRSFTSVSSSGWYHISSSISIGSGSSPYSTLKTTADRIFWAPLSTLSTNIGTNTKAVGYFGYNILTATSRSLSGAPYLTAATWMVSSSVTGLFNPLFGSSATLARQVVAGNISIANPAVGAYAASITTGLINTANTVYDSTGVTVRNTATIPFLTDIVRLTGSISLNIGTGTNIAQTGLSPTTFTVATYGTDKDGTEGSALNTQTIPYHSASTFGQPLASGSLAYYGQAQGYDGGTLTGTSEALTGETYRVQLTNKLLSGSYAASDAWITTYGIYNLGILDLQVKPGYLARPGGTYGYWITDPDSSKTYKYYARAFQRSSATAATALTINVGKTLVNWQSSTSGVSVALMFKSSGPANGYSTPRIYDPSELTSNLISSSMANDNFKNPFTNNIALYGNTGGSLSTTTYTVPLRGADGMVLDGTIQDYIVLIRYNGDQSPVSSITVSYI